MATKITLSVWAQGIEALMEAQGMPVGQIQNAVNSALGELTQTDEDAKGTASIKVPKKGPEQFKLTERQVNKFQGSVSSPLRLYYFNQELLALEKITGQIDLNGWPEYLAGWMAKFAPKAEKVAA